MIVLHATFPLDPDGRDEAVELFEEHAKRSRAEDGVVEFRAAADLSDPNVIRVVERYEDEAALETHSRSEHVQRLGEALLDLLDGEPELRRFDVESAAEIDI